MPFNLLKKYNEHLDLLGLDEYKRKTSLMGIFNRDIANNQQFKFKGKQITPTPLDGEIKMSTLYTHLTTVIVEKETRKREFDLQRAVRLHWVKFHIDEMKKDDIICFSVKEPEGVRTYIYDINEKYVIVLEPLRNKSEYYLLTAYYLTGRDNKRDKILKKYQRKLNEIL